MNVFLRISRSILRWTPWAALLTAAYYAVSAVVPAVIAAVTVRLFGAAERTLAGEPMQSAIYLNAGLYLGIYLVSDLLGFVRSIVLNARLYEVSTANFRLALYEKMSRLPLIAYEDAACLDRAERARKAVEDETFPNFFNAAIRCARSAVTVLSVGMVLSRYSLWLLPLSLLTALPYLIARVIRGKEFYYIKRAQAAKTRRLSYLWSLFSDRAAAREMRVMGFGPYLAGLFQKTRDEVNEELWAVERRDARSLLLCDGIRIAGYGLSILLVLALVLTGRVSIGVFGACIAAFLSVQEGMREFLQRLGNFPELAARARDYYALIDAPEAADGSRDFPGLRAKIELRGVGFRYPGAERRALEDVNLSIRPGEKVAILGVNGSGKTTLGKVLLGLYAPESGEVRYDGRPLGEFSGESFLREVSAIAQDFARYNLSLRENVAISDVARMGADAAIRETLAAVNAGRGIELDAQLGRAFGGAELSLGQWQKLAIGRGLFRPASLILLDEPTSTLDPLVESEILSAFLRAARDKTALIISHRVGLCRLVDRIVVMRGGRIVEAGRHEALLRADGEYARLYRAQARWYR